MPDFNQLGISLRDFHKKSTVPNFTEICPVGAALIHADRGADRHKEGTA